MGAGVEDDDKMKLSILRTSLNPQLVNSWGFRLSLSPKPDRHLKKAALHETTNPTKPEAKKPPEVL